MTDSPRHEVIRVEVARVERQERGCLVDRLVTGGCLADGLSDRSGGDRFDHVDRRG